MRRLVLVVALLLVMPGLASAQTATSANKLTWDQTAPDAATALSYTYKLYTDGGATGSALSSVTCAASATSGVFTCQVPLPAFTPGGHSVQLTASNAAGESTKSNALSFTFVVIPPPPGNLRLQ